MRWLAYCVGRGASGERERRGENERQQQLDSAVGFGMRRECRRAAQASGEDGERREAEG